MLDFAALRREVTVAARDAFGVVRVQHPDEKFYAFALYSDDSAMTICPAANTDLGHDRCVNRYSKYTPPIPISSNEIRWSTAEWAYEGCEDRNQFDRVCEIINSNEAYAVDDPNEFIRFKGRVFATMVLGLQDLDSNGFFGTEAIPTGSRFSAPSQILDARCGWKMSRRVA